MRTQKYITPTLKEIDELMEVSPDIIAVDATFSSRPNSETLDEFFIRSKRNIQTYF